MTARSDWIHRKGTSLRPATTATATPTTPNRPARRRAAATGSRRRDLNPNHPDFEECDDGNDSDDDECSTTCISLGCGNGQVDAGEQCDDGNIEDTDACTNGAARHACGDGHPFAGAQRGEKAMRPCDDGNGRHG